MNKTIFYYMDFGFGVNFVVQKMDYILSKMVPSRRLFLTHFFLIIQIFLPLTKRLNHHLGLTQLSKSTLAKIICIVLCVRNHSKPNFIFVIFFNDCSMYNIYKDLNKSMPPNNEVIGFISILFHFRCPLS